MCKPFGAAKMKFILCITAMVGLLIHPAANSAEPKGRVIKVYPQKSSMTTSDIKTDVLVAEKEIKEFNLPIDSKIITNTDGLSAAQEQNKQVQVSASPATQKLSEPTKPEVINESDDDVVNISPKYQVTLQSGLLKPQLNELVRKYLPSHDVYWGNYEGKHEWYGEAVIKGDSIEDLLNEITSSYGKPPKGIAWYIHLNVVEFVYKNTKG